MATATRVSGLRHRSDGRIHHFGDGRDTVAIGILFGASAINFFGDNGSNFNADLIDFAVDTGTNGFVRRRGGSDTITISGVQASSNIQGNDGADSIALSAGVEGINAGIVIGGAEMTPSMASSTLAFAGSFR